MIAAIQRTLVGRTLAALAALAILVGGWHAATAHGGAHLGVELHERAHVHTHPHAHDHEPASGVAQDASHDRIDHDRIDHDHPQSLAAARRASAAPAGGARLAVAHQGSPPQRSDAPFRPPRA